MACQKMAKEFVNDSPDMPKLMAIIKTTTTTRTKQQEEQHTKSTNVQASELLTCLLT